MRSGLEEVRTSQMEFLEFQTMCQKSCHSHPDKLKTACGGAALSAHWLDYTASCDKNKENCHIPVVRWPLPPLKTPLIP
jgi:hypothetical protein